MTKNDTSCRIENLIIDNVSIIMNTLKNCRTLYFFGGGWRKSPPLVLGGYNEQDLQIGLEQGKEYLGGRFGISERTREK